MDFLRVLICFGYVVTILILIFAGGFMYGATIEKESIAVANLRLQQCHELITMNGVRK